MVFKNKLADRIALVTLGSLISLLIIGMLFPFVACPCRHSQRSACASNMKQIYIGLQSYAADNGDRLPPVADNGGKIDLQDPKNQWPSRILKYIKSDKLFKCSAVTPGMMQSPSIPGDPIKTCYGMNIRFSTGGSKCALPKDMHGSIPIMPMALDSPAQPSKTVLLIETQAELQWKGSSIEQSIKLPNGKSTYKVPPTLAIAPYADWGDGCFDIRWFDFPYAPFGHTSGTHVVCADGHVKFIKQPKTRPATEQDAPIHSAGLTWWKPLKQTD